MGFFIVKRPVRRKPTGKCSRCGIDPGMRDHACVLAPAREVAGVDRERLAEVSRRQLARHREGK